MTEESSLKLVEESLEMADEALEEAKLLSEANKLRGAVSRAYYAMFDASRALLYSKGVETKTHKGVMSLLGEKFVKTKELDKWFSKVIGNAFELRQASDYEIEVSLDRVAVEQLVKDAEKFVKEAKEFLNK